MNLSTQTGASRLAVPPWFCIVSMLLLGGALSAQTVRVTTYDFASAWGSDATNVIEAAGLQLNKLAPDVILLRGVSGWKMCSQLAQALKPAQYRVAICSAFRDASGSNAAPLQVAILARDSSYFSWSEAWSSSTNSPPSGGGFAFAAIPVEGHRFGFCASDMPLRPVASTEEATRQWLETLGSFRGWANNKLEGFVTGAFGPITTNGEAGRLLRSAGFVDARAWSSQSVKAEATESHLVPDAKSPGGLLLTRWPMTCDFDFHPAPVVVVAANPSAPTNVLVASAAVPPPPTTHWSSLMWPVAAGLAVVLVAIVIMLISIRRRLSGLQAQNALLVHGPLQNPTAALGYNVAIAPPALSSPPLQVARAANEPAKFASVEPRQDQLPRGVFAHLTHWLKETFIQRLLADRKELLDTQQEATMKVLAVDQRLARLELKIQQETASYEKQIEQLNRELLTAREENLELIRGQINLLKAEMEDARKRVLEAEEV